MAQDQNSQQDSQDSYRPYIRTMEKDLGRLQAVPPKPAVTPSTPPRPETPSIPPVPKPPAAPLPPSPPKPQLQPKPPAPLPSQPPSQPSPLSLQPKPQAVPPTQRIAYYGPYPVAKRTFSLRTILFILGGVVVLGGLLYGGFTLYQYLRTRETKEMKPRPARTAPLPQAPEATPVAFFTREPEKTVTLTLPKKDRPTLLAILETETKNPGTPGTITRILVKAGGAFLQTREFLEILGVDPSPGFLRILTPNFVLFASPEAPQGPNRLGIVLQTTNVETAKEALAGWEPSLERDWLGLFLNLPISRPPEAAFQTELFEFLPVRRLSLPTPDLSVNYTFFETYLILTTSQKSIENAIRHFVLP